MRRKKHEGRLELTWTNKDQALLSSGDGKYDYTFVDPTDRRVNEVRLLHEVERIEAPVPQDRPDYLPFPTFDNLLITGDAMHVLDVLTKTPEYSEMYLGKVKLVYIDPPFNTGKAFAHYEDNIDHSVWLTMLRDRVRQIKPLLAPDGSIWVHLDDAEVHRCRLVLDEELGEERFAASVIWRSADTGNYDDQRFSSDHNTILVYSATAAWGANSLPRSAQQASHYANPDNDPRGPWFDGNPLGSPNPRQNLMYDVVSPTGAVIKHPPHGWRWKRETFDEMVADGRIRFNDKGTRVVYRTYLAEQSGLPPSTLWDRVSETGSNRKAKNELKRLFKLPAKQVFETPKPEALIARILAVATEPGDIVLDCFGGSGATAAVAHKLGRRWVTCELQEHTLETFAKPRLESVVRGNDPGGVTTSSTREEVPGVPIPAGMTPEDAYGFQAALRRVSATSAITVPLASLLSDHITAADDEPSALTEAERDLLLGLLLKASQDDSLATVDITAAATRPLLSATRTRAITTTVWHGGGGFTHLKVGPSMFEEVAGFVVLADWATNGALTEAMCAQIGVAHEPDGPFAGRLGRTRVAVIDGMVGTETVDALTEELLVGETLDLWVTQATDDAEQRLTEARPGSRLLRIPQATLDGYRRRSGDARPFARSSEGDS